MKLNFKLILMCSVLWMMWSLMGYLMYSESIKESNPVIPLTVSLVVYVLGLYFILKDILEKEDAKLNKQEVKTNGNN